MCSKLMKRMFCNVDKMCVGHKKRRVGVRIRVHTIRTVLGVSSRKLSTKCTAAKCFVVCNG